MGKARSRVIAVLLAGAGACTSEATPRPQLVLVVDTDVPVIGQLTGRDDLSRASAIDTVRVDVLAADGSIRETRELVVPDVRDWPISFGITPPVEGFARLRLRAFRSNYARRGTLGDKATLEPTPDVTIDRVVWLTFPADGVRTSRVRLNGDCIGRPVSFVPPHTTCIDGATMEGDPASAIEVDAAASVGSTSEIGSWAGARYVACKTDPPNEGAVCIPGGYAILGELTIVGLEAGNTSIHDSVPLRPVMVTPFYLDRHEVTVGRLRKLGAAALLDVDPPRPRDAATRDVNCTWLGFATAANDALPLNCVSWKTAQHVCKVLGGSLPTEAQWEYAARGRGEQRTYPWGSTHTSQIRCCTLSAERGTTSKRCGQGVEPVGTHADPTSCDGVVDVSRDGIVDLGGSMAEHLLDVYRPYTAACWGGLGITADPRCLDDASEDHSRRGTAWSDSTGGAAVALRASNRSGDGATRDQGFRCAYRGAPE